MSEPLPKVNFDKGEAYRLLNIQIENGLNLAEDLQKHGEIYNAPSMGWLRTEHEEWLNATHMVLSAVFDTDSYVHKFDKVTDERAEYLDASTGCIMIDYDSVNLSNEVKNKVDWLVEVRDTYLNLAQEINASQPKDNDFVKDLIHQDLQSSYRAINNNDTYEAVKHAFQQIDVVVGKFTHSKHSSTTLMSEAFEPKMGLLTDKNIEERHREGLTNILVGAMKYYRNRCTHMQVEFTPEQAKRLVLFASEMLFTIEAAAKREGLDT